MNLNCLKSLMLGAAAVSTAQMQPAFAATRGGDPPAAPQTVVAFSNQCVQSNWPIEEERGSGDAAPLLAALGALLLPRLVDFGVSYVANRVREAGQRRETVIQASADGYFAESDPLAPQFRIHPKMNCIILAHGVMRAAGDSVDERKIDPKFLNAAYDEAGLHFAQTPNLYFEGAIDWSDIGDSFRVIAAHVDSRKTVAEGVRGDAMARKLGLALTFKDGAGTPFAEGTMSFSSVQFGVPLEAGALGLNLPETRGVPAGLVETYRKQATENAKHSTGWMTALKPSPDEMQALFQHCEENGCPNPVRVRPGDDAAAGINDALRNDAVRAAPFTMTANLTETKDQQLLLLFMADGLELSKGVITPAVVGRALKNSELNPYDPAWAAKRDAAQAACKALYNAVKGTKESFEAYQDANGGVGPATELKDDAIAAKNLLSAARAAYAAALIPEYLLAVDIASGCKLTAS